jgi:ribonuclease-3
MEFSAQSSKTLNEIASGGDPAAAELVSTDAGTIQELEATLGHRFVRAELLQRALTHSSLAHERGAAEPEREDNETLEFLGDAVVGMIAAEYVFRCYPDLAEGDLTRLRGALVGRRHLAEVAAELKLGKYLRLGRTKTALLANAMEAVIGAIYLDAGLEAARKLIEVRVIAPVIGPLREQLTASGGMGDFKSALQELLQAQRQGQPDYRTTGEDGPDHRKQFFVEVRVGGTALAEGEGRTRKHAEQDAARRAIEKLQGDKLQGARAAE